MAPSLRNRKPSKPETGSDTDAGDDALDEQYAPSAPPAATQAHSKGEGKLQKVVKRLVFGTLLLLTLCVIVASGHLATLGLVQVPPPALNATIRSLSECNFWYHKAPSPDRHPSMISISLTRA